MKICPLGAELLHPDRETETDRMKLTDAIRNFVHTPVKEFQIFNVQPNASNREQWAAHLLCI